MANDLSLWNPAEEFTNIRRMMNRLMGGSLESMGREPGLASMLGAGVFVPPVEIEDLGNEFLVRAELPGLTENDVQLTVSGRVLTIRGEKRYQRTVTGEEGGTQQEGAKRQAGKQGNGSRGDGGRQEREGSQFSTERPMFSERAYGSFERVITLPDDVDAEHIDANFHHGVLEVRVPRSEERKPRQIPVKIH